MPSRVLECSFCGQPRESGRRLVANDFVSICEECVELIVDILANEPEGSGGLPPPAHANDDLKD
jgi:ATP-dependent protease Clp ATPase subunit